MSGSKSKFAENMDFKALSPDFHAIATSKFSYVWNNINEYTKLNDFAIP